MRITYYFKVLFFVGLTLAFLSCFVEWYSIKIFLPSGEIVVWWRYHLLSEWTTPLTGVYNEFNRIDMVIYPLSLNSVLLVLIIFSGYIALFSNIEKTKPEKNKNFYAYGIMVLPFLLIYYIWVFPWHLGGFYYNVSFTDPLSGNKFVNTVGSGFFLQICSFPMIFAYSFFYFLTALRYEKKNTVPDAIENESIQNTYVDLDLDRLIEEEEVEIYNKNLGKK